MNQYLEASILNEVLTDDSLRRDFLNKLRPDYFFTPSYKKVFLFLQKKWLDDPSLSIEAMTNDMIKSGLLDTFLDITRTPVGNNFNKNINYLKKTYLEFERNKAVEIRDFERAIYLEEEKKKLNFAGNAYYTPEEIESRLKDASENGLNLTTYAIHDKVDLKIVKNQTTVLTGIPRAGKTNFADQISINLAYKYNWRIVMFSPEAQPVKLHLANIYAKYCGEPVLKSGRNINTIWFNDHIKLINTNNIRRELDVVLGLVQEESPDLFIIDPWNTLIQTKDNSKQFISESFDMIKEITFKTDSHALIIAHPRIMEKAQSGKYEGWYPPVTAYQISGAAEWYSKPDNILSLWRPKQGTDVELHVQKVKWEHILGEVEMFPLKYKIETGEYV